MDGLAEGEIAVDVHNLIVIGVSAIVLRTICLNPLNRVARVTLAEEARRKRIVAFNLSNGHQDTHIRVGAESARKIKRRNGIVRILFLGNVNALCCAGRNIGIGIPVALFLIASSSVLVITRNLRLAVQCQRTRNIGHACIAARTVAFNRAAVYVAARASCDIESINRQGAVCRARTRTMEILHRAVIEIKRSVGDAHHSSNSIRIQIIGISETRGFFD